jgi:hypothetical protein
MSYYFAEGHEDDAMILAADENAAWDVAKYELNIDPHSMAGPYVSEADLLDSHDVGDADSNY